MTVDEVLRKYPVLYHMAEQNTWPSIEEHGLLSSQALVELINMPTDVKDNLLTRRRKHSFTCTAGFVIRDQRPMSDGMLRYCLEDMSPNDWYRQLNSKVFFWTTKKRLNKFQAAYKNRRQLIIEIDTLTLIERYKESIKLCPINSGATRHKDHKRGTYTFKSIEDYDRCDVAELTVEGMVKDIKELTLLAYETGNGEPISMRFERSKTCGT